MTGKVSIEADRARGLVRIVMTGLLTPDDVEQFYEMRRRAHAALGLPRNAHLTLNDVRGLKILPQDVLTAFCEMLADPAFHSRRLAFIVSPTLVRGQVARALGGREEARCFADVEAAEAWLFEEDATGTPPLRSASLA